ncbi:MAG: hypothetical protein ACRYFU_16450 [Janthinobacterium lividum]
MNTMDCTTCRSQLPDLLLEPGFATEPAAAAHLAACADCRTELEELNATFALMDAWAAPEPSPYFDARLHAHLREAEREAPEGLWERLVATLRFSTGRRLVPALAGAFLFLLLLGGGTVATLLESHPAAPAISSPAVNDLKIYDNNAQALEQMDLLDEPGSDAGATPPQS